MDKQKSERLDKILAQSGFGSRKDVKKIIKQGGVSVNGELVKDAATQIYPYDDTLKVWGNIVEFKKYIYIMLNKPSGVLSATRDGLTTTVIDLLEGEFSHRKLFPVGRLDKDTKGLILLTDDGKLAHRLLSPKYRVDKLYYVEVEGKLDEDDIDAFETGIELDDFTTLPAKLDIIEADDISRAFVTICEGKFHQVKRMMKAQGKEVVYLERLSLGPLCLDETLEPGEWRELTEEETQLLLNFQQ